MNFINSFKRLEKLCNEIYGDIHGVKHYYDEMENTPRGSHLVSGWDEDLKLLKHYNWVRNQISHEPDCTEENMCEPGDAEWIENFHSRIMNQTDPLAMYHKAITPHPTEKVTQTKQPTKPPYTIPVQQNQPKKKSKKALGWAVFIIAAVCIALIFALKYFN